MIRRTLYACMLSLAALLYVPTASAQITVGATEPEKPKSEASVHVLNREIATFRAELLGISAETRANRAEQRIKEQLALNPQPVLSIEPHPIGSLFLLDDVMVFALTTADVDVLSQQTLDQNVAATQQKLEKVIAESGEARNADFMLRATGIALLATLILLAVIWLLYRLRRLITVKLVQLTGNKELAVGGIKLLTRDRVFLVFAKLSHLLFLLTAFVLTYEWLSVVMAQFPYTRPWGEGLQGFLFGMAAKFGKAILGAVPNLLTATAIFLLASWLIRLTKGFFDQIASGKARFGRLDAELANPTRKLVSAVIWIFALVMAYPYLPGSDSAAFKGVSVLLGVMLSLGSSNIISQGASGMILTFSRTFRIGEFVKIGDHEGTVSALGMFNTRLRTGMGEEVTLSNANVFSSVIRNYSRTNDGHGYVLDTTVTIGYDTPWRQVEAMLLEAAAQTDGISSNPPPRVFQTALSDFYPEYRLVCNATPTQPRPRAMALSDLHANIQDAFNKYGVQIMSPHYMHDPNSEKIVSEQRKYAAPAKRPE
jgi:small-conductance mechanosensitive channel